MGNTEWRVITSYADWAQHIRELCQMRLQPFPVGLVKPAIRRRSQLDTRVRKLLGIGGKPRG